MSSKVDRHESLAHGAIGALCFHALINDARLANVPAVLETPGDDVEQYADEIAWLRALRGVDEATALASVAQKRKSIKPPTAASLKRTASSRGVDDDAADNDEAADDDEADAKCACATATTETSAPTKTKRARMTKSK